MTAIPVAVQMYTLREANEQDFAGTIRKVAEIGYAGVEFAGFYGLAANEVKALLDETGLKAAGSHVSIDLLENDFEQVVATHETIQCNRIICPFFPPEQLKSAEDYKSLASRLNVIGQKLVEKGFTFGYHNHAFELDMFDGKSGLEIIFAETNPEFVKVELDIYWVKRGGHDPAEWIKKYEGRLNLVHLKDMTTDDEQFFAELGTGGIDLKSVIEQSKKSGVEWFIVEQDQSRRSALESVEISFNYLKEQGWV